MGSVLDIASEKEIEDFYSSNVVETTTTNVTTIITTATIIVNNIITSLNIQLMTFYNLYN